MATINIPEAEKEKYEAFIFGKPVRVHAVEIDGDRHQFMKGSVVTVSHLNMQATGRVISEPEIVQYNRNSDKQVVAVVVSKI